MVENIRTFFDMGKQKKKPEIPLIMADIDPYGIIHQKKTGG